MKTHTKVIIVHGWEGKPDSNWFPWLTRELEKKHITVLSPQFPPDTHPKMHEWLAVLEHAKPDSNTILVGHSLGVIAILCYLESHNTPVRGAVLVSGFARKIKFTELEDFFHTPVNFIHVKANCAQFTVINSDNDPFVPLIEGEYIARELGVQLIIAPGAGHISANQGNITAYQSILDAVLKASTRQ